MIRLGLQIPTFDYPGIPDEALFEHVASIATTAESSGFDSIWVMDHFHQITGRPADPILEGYTALAALAARTSRVNLGTLVTGVTYRNPATLAKMVTTLDVVSSGRAILGIGAAWNEREAIAYGYEFPATRERMDRLEEAVQICRLMFTEPAPSFEGRYHRISEAHNSPRPVRPGGPPILIGGGGEKRTLKLVARYADACNIGGDLPTLRRKLAVLDEHCDAAGRDPTEITRTNLRTLVIGATAADAARKGAALREVWGVAPERYDMVATEGDPAQVAELVHAMRDAGLDGTIVNLPDVYNLETVALAGEVLSRL